MGKKDIYLDILQGSLLQIRSVSTHGAFFRARDKSVYYESQLIHEFYLLLKNDDFNDLDIWFLNRNARWYYDDCSEKKSFLYEHQLKRISSLFSLVPEKMRDKLEWYGPEIK
ncbi:hypothetical protein [Klebsiella spallanzanii]|uniref:hypothetical protein n=1 Tax=Klebsiella spallanzanii TaxID=2587528 RepID=UPI001119958C|nr:hypothetical protein [Klebsiella spallanzanii]